jgi:hypothetical protein
MDIATSRYDDIISNEEPGATAALGSIGVEDYWSIGS